MSDVAPSTVLRGWLFALRDLCEQGATAARVTLADGVTLLYRPGRGATVLAPSGTLEIPDSALDEIGLVPVSAASGKEDSP